MNPETFKKARYVIAISVGTAVVIYTLNASDVSNVIPTVPAATSVLLHEQKIPVENTPEPYKNDFRELFEKLSVQEIKPEKPIDDTLAKDFIEQAGHRILSEDAITTRFSGRFGKRGVQKSIILESKDHSISVALSAHLQGVGPTPMSADIRVLKAIMINRDTKESIAVWLSDLKEGELTVFASSELSRVSDFSYWDKGESLYYYFPELKAASQENLLSLVNVLKDGTVNSALTQKSAGKLDEKYNSDVTTPSRPKPQPTPRHF